MAALVRAALTLAVFCQSGGASRLRPPKANEEVKLKLDNFNNVQYAAPLTVGSITMPVIYDTGSFEILVLSSLCHSCSRDHTFYDSKKSTTFVEARGVTAEHLFGSGPVLSEKGYETIHMGRQYGYYWAKAMPFWQVIDHGIAVWNQNAHFSGIVGLGHPSYIPEGFSAEPVPDQTLLSKIGIQNFAFCLQRGGPAAVSPGWLMIGPTINTLGHQSKAFRTVDVVGKVHWGVKLTGIGLIGGGPGAAHLRDPCIPSCGAIVDSGTSLIAVPPSAQGLTSHLSYMIRKDCSNLESLPTLRMTIGGQDIELPPRAYVVQGYSGCEPGFMAIDKQSQYGPVWILGMPFLRYYFTIFDRSNLKIHIADATPTCKMPAADPAWGHSWHNATTLVNASSAGGVATGSRAFAAADYQPTPVDMNSTRIPEWAKEGYHTIEM